MTLWSTHDASSARAQRGMTLIEILIAMATLAFMAISVIIVFRNSTDVQQDIRARTELSQMGRNAMELMRREIYMAYVSTQTTEEWQTFFKATDRDPIDEVHFVTRGHEKRYSNVKESDLAEISYVSESDRTGGAYATLIHREDTTIDDQWDRGGTVLPLSHNVRRLNLRYYDPKKEEWLDEWDSEQAEQLNKPPSAVEIHLELEDAVGNTATFFTRGRIMPHGL
ncbi:MAG: prepilin-type N-terminal cleavage/methylation domain-containing protein [Deltaproteobacteria bacterium]|nr:prepilin-type N-terminal cleavage/methylation domain-containing protein [Deltaproteobacteria bacterium]